MDRNDTLQQVSDAVMQVPEVRVWADHPRTRYFLNCLNTEDISKIIPLTRSALKFDESTGKYIAEGIVLLDAFHRGKSFDQPSKEDRKIWAIEFGLDVFPFTSERNIRRRVPK